MVKHARLTDAQKAQIEERNKAEAMERELALHQPQVRQLSAVIRQSQVNIRFSKKELELTKDAKDVDFIPSEPRFSFESTEAYGKFQREMKIDGLELGIEMAEEKLELDVIAYESEKEKVDKLLNGELLSE